MSTPPKYKDLAIFRRLLRHTRPYWPHMGAIFALGFVSIPLSLLTPLPLKIVVDSVIGSHPLPGFVETFLPTVGLESRMEILWFAVALLLLVTLLSSLIWLARWLLSEYIGEKMVLDFRCLLFQHAQRLSLAYHDTRGTADSTYRIQYCAPGIRWLLLDDLISFVTEFGTLAAMIYVTARISWELALVALGVCPVLMVLTWRYTPRLRVKWREVTTFEMSAFSVIQEALAAIRVVQAFGQEEREQSRFFDRSRRGFFKRISAVFMQGSFDLSTGMTIGIGTAAVLFIGVSQVLAEEITVGELLLIMAYLAQLYTPMRAIGKRIARQQEKLASVERVFALLDEVPAVVERKGAKPVSRVLGAVSFKNVSFSYDDTHSVLRDISLDVPAGASVGLAGETGAGKTTLVTLLTRFYDPTEGEILIDGRDLRDYKLADLRDQFSIVLQEPVLFSSSIAANIAYARPDASMDEIVAATAAAKAHDFIVDLPEGYDTLVGERGMRLSGGERQRISLARAFLKDAPLLILDEPTSSVDIRTEAGIMGAMGRLMKGRTTFLIAHRPSTLKGCDLLLVIENGRVANLTSDVAGGLSVLADFSKDNLEIDTLDLRGAAQS